MTQHPSPSPSILASVYGIAKLGLQADPGRAIIVLIACVAQEGTTLALAIWIGLLVDAASSGRGADLGWMPAAAGVTMGLVLAALLGGWRIRVRFREQLEAFVDRRMMRTLGAPATIALHEDPRMLDKIEVLRNQRTVLTSAFESGATLLGALTQLGLTVLLLASAAPIVAILPFAALPVLLASRWGVGVVERARLAASADLRVARGLENLAGQPAAREFRLFGLNDLMRQKHLAHWLRGGKTIAAGDFRSAVVMGLAWTVFVSAYGLAIVFVLRSAAAGDITPGKLALALVLASQVAGQVRTSLSLWINFLGGVQIASLYQQVMEAAGRLHARREGNAAPPDRLAHGITLDRVDLTYANTNKAALKDLSFHIPAGAVVALVGENGAGKTTLVKILAGLAAPSSGRILIDGVAMDTLDLDRWRRSIAVALQDYCRFELTIQHTVGCGDIQLLDDQQAVVSALERTGGLPVLSSLGGSLDARLGKSWDGKELSGGQWQSLALGRGAMRSQPLLRILDEPTSSLDAQTEDEVFRRYAQLGREDRGGGITVLVTHRFATTRTADLILHLQNGALVEAGTHEALMAANGPYAELYQMQARHLH